MFETMLICQLSLFIRFLIYCFTFYSILFINSGKVGNIFGFLCLSALLFIYKITQKIWGNGGRVVTLLPPTSDIGVPFTALPQVGKLVVACHWLAVYNTEP